MSGQPKRTWTYKEDLPDQANGRPNVEEMQEEYLKSMIGKRLMSELTKKMWRDDMIISRGMVYGKELDEYIGREREKYAIRGFVCGALCICIMWMIILGV